MDDARDDRDFHAWLVENDLASCKHCGRAIDRGDLAWNDASTEAGTEYSVVQITCQRCWNEVAHFTSWYPGAMTFREVIDNILPDYSLPT